MGQALTSSADIALRARSGVELQFARIVGRTFEPHFHDEYQLMLIVDGSVLLHVDGIEYSAAQGDVCVIMPRQVHALRSQGWGWISRVFYPPPEVVDSVAAELGLPPAPHFANPIIRDAVVSHNLADAHAALENDIEDLRQALALLIARHSSTGAPSHMVASTRVAEDYIRAHFTERVTLDELAALCGFSRFHFLRVFAREWGLTPHAYQAQLRTAHALNLLRHGAGAAEAALAAGYADQSHLIRRLRRSHALTPALIQRAH